MKQVIAILIMLTVAVSAQAADPTTDALNARFVEDYITLSAAPGKDGKTIVQFTIDGGSSPKAIDGMHFRSNGEIAVHLKNFNPLTESWIVEATATPDVSHAAIKAFLDDLTTLQPALAVPLERPAAPLATTGPPSGGGAQPHPGCVEFNKRIREAYNALIAKELTAAKLNTFVNAANTYAGVTDALAQFAQTQNDIVTNNNTARTALAAIRSEFGSLEAAPKLDCPDVTGQILVDYIHVHSTAEQIISTKEALHKQLGEISTVLKRYSDRRKWRGPQLDEYAIDTVKPTPAEQQDITTSIKTKSVSLANNSIVVTDEDDEVEAKFDVRNNSFFVAERAAAMVYNSLTYPQYGTGTNAAGETIIVQTEDRKPIDGALMLNLVTRLGGPSVAHPFIQFGVSSAKDFPGFLAGLGFRFTAPFAFSISAGGMITRYKDLDDRSLIGKTVSGTAEIEDHLVYKTTPVAIYGAMELKF